METITIHIGLYKTASTLMQGKIIRPINPNIFAKYKHIGSFFNYFNMNSSQVWESVIGQRFIDNIIHFANSPHYIFSNEELYAAKIFRTIKEGHFTLEPARISDHLSHISKALSKRKIQLKVLFFTRCQTTWLPSQYTQLSDEMRNPNQMHFEQSIGKLLNNPTQFGGQCIEYDLLYKYLSNAVGQDNVLAFPFEDMYNMQIWEEIENFTNVCGLLDNAKKHIHVKINKKSLREKQWALRNHNKSPLVLHNKTENDIFNHYKSSNERFQKLINKNLIKFGYC